MFTVALIGPDGCGKTTVARRLEASLGLPVRYVYMGVNLDSSNLVLPSTWLWLRLKRAVGRRPDMSGPPDPTRRSVAPRGLLRRSISKVKSALRLGNLLAEEWFRQRIIAFHRSRRRVVLLDRDFFADYYAHDVAPPKDEGIKRGIGSRLHGFVLRRLYRRPDMVILLDAPAQLLFERKGEGTIELLQRRQQEYLRLREAVPHFYTVDAVQPLDGVLADVREVILGFHRQLPSPASQRSRPTESRSESTVGASPP